MRSENVVIRTLEDTDIDGVAAVHKAAFPDSVLTSLGESVVRFYYSELLSGSGRSHCAGAFVGTELIGYHFSGELEGVMRKFVRGNIWIILRSVAGNPSVIGRVIAKKKLIPVFRMFLSRGLSTGSRSNVVLTDYAGQSVKDPAYRFLVTAVEPRFQGRGVGRKMRVEAEREAARAGAAAVGCTVAVHNVKAIGLYKSMGWGEVYENGEWKGKMMKTL